MTQVQRILSNVRGAFGTMWRHRLLVLAVFVVLMGASLYLVGHMQRNYVAGANLLVVNGTTRDDPTLSSPDLPSIATSTVVLSRMEKSIGLDLPLVAVKHHLTVKPPPFRSSILRVEYSDPEADRAMRVANGVADELTRYYREISIDRFDDDLRALDRELRAEQAKARRIDDQLQRYGPPFVAAKAGDPAGGGGPDVETTRALAIATLKGDVAHLNALRNDAANRSKMMRYDILQHDPTYHDLQASAAAADVQLANARAQFTSAYPELPGLVEKSTRLHAELDAEARRALSASDAYSPMLQAARAEQRTAEALVVADQAKVAAYDKLIDTDRERGKSVPSLTALRLQRDAAQASYLAISARRATALANRADALSLGSVVIVDRAIATDAQVVGLGKNRLLAMMAALALCLALCSAFVADQLNPRLSRAAQIEDLYGSPVVATIGKM